MVLALLLLFVANAQVPQSCRGNSTCCPLFKNAICGGINRGECVSSGNASSSFTSCRVATVWNSICQCKDNFFGVSCEDCAPGYRGDNCSEAYVVPRYSYWDLTSDEKQKWISAVQAMKKTNDPSFQSQYEPPSASYSVYDTFTLLHEWSIINEFNVTFAHGGPGFITWHRYFIWLWEKQLHKYGFPEYLGSPYWPWGSDAATRDLWMTSPEFGEATGFVTTGAFANWSLVGIDKLPPPVEEPPGTCPTSVPQVYRDANLLWRENMMCNSSLPSIEYVDQVANMTGYDCYPWNNQSDCYRNYFEGFIPPPRNMHNVVHLYIGGAMRYIPISANDPMFYLHHTEVDHLFEDHITIKGGIDSTWVFPVTGATEGHCRYDCIMPLYPPLSNNYWLKAGTRLGYIYMPPSTSYPPLQQAEELRDEILLLIKNGLPHLPPVNRGPQVAIVGAGVSGLVAARTLVNAGYKVEVHEADTLPGGRLDTHSCNFRGVNVGAGYPEFPEGGAMRYPCNHWATFAYWNIYNLSKRIFQNSNPNTLILLECFDNTPFPRYALDPSDSRYDPTLWEQIWSADCFDVTSPPERLPSDVLVDMAMKPWIHVLWKASQEDPASLTATWDRIAQFLDSYTVKDFFSEFMRYSPQAINMIGVVSNMESFFSVSFLEMFRDSAGQWWNDGIKCQWPEGDLYADLPIKQIWQLRDGSEALTNALFDDVREFVRFGSRVAEIRYDSSSVTVGFVTQDETVLRYATYDYLILAVPYSVVRTLYFYPPVSAAKQLVTHGAYYLPSTKVMFQLRNRAPLYEPNPNVPPQFEYPGLPEGGGGGSTTDTVLGPLYYPSSFPTGSVRGTGLFYQWGRNAQIVGSMTQQQLGRTLISVISNLHGEAAAESLEFWDARAWSQESTEQGALGMNLPGDYSLFSDFISSENGRIFFCGDDKSRFHGWVQGAIISSLQAVQQLDALARNVTSFPVNPNYFPDNEVCGNDLLLQPTTLQANVEWQIPTIPFERVGYIINGTIAFKIAGLENNVSAGGYVLIPTSTTATATALFTSATLLFSQEKYLPCKGDPAKPLLEFEPGSDESLQFPVEGNITQLFLGESFSATQDFASQLEIGIGSLNKDSETSGLYFGLNGQGYVIGTGNPADNTYLKLTIGTKPWTIWRLIFSGLSSFSVSFLYDKPWLFQQPTLGAIFSEIELTTPGPFCIAGMVDFQAIKGQNLIKSPVFGEDATNISATYYRPITYTNRTAVIAGCVGTAWSSYLSSTIVKKMFSTSMDSAVWGLIMQAGYKPSSLEEIDQQKVESVIEILQNSVPVKLTASVYRLNTTEEQEEILPCSAPQAKDKGLIAGIVVLAVTLVLVISILGWMYKKKGDPLLRQVGT